MLKKLLFPLIGLLLSGCSAVAPPPHLRDDAISIMKESVNQMPQAIVWNDFNRYNEGIPDWLTVASQRFNNPVVFVCHGGIHSESYIDGAGKYYTKTEWWVYPDAPRQPMPVDKIAESLANLYPGRDIVLITCNPGAFDLHVKRIWYSKKAVWTVPNAFANRTDDKDAIGNIWDFMTYDGSKTGETARFYLDSPTTLPTTCPSVKVIK